MKTLEIIFAIWAFGSTICFILLGIHCYRRLSSRISDSTKEIKDNLVVKIDSAKLANLANKGDAGRKF